VYYFIVLCCCLHWHINHKKIKRKKCIHVTRFICTIGNQIRHIERQENISLSLLTWFQRFESRGGGIYLKKIVFWTIIQIQKYMETIRCKWLIMKTAWFHLANYKRIVLFFGKLTNKTEGATKNGQSRETVYIENTKRRLTKQKTEHHEW
jgi:hypothetical protein